MPLAHAIVHGITRAGINAPVQLQLADQAIACNGISEELVRELKQAFVAKAGKQYGRFTSDPGAAQFSSWLRDFCEERLGFESFTRKVCEHWQSKLTETETEFYGHLLFAVEKLADADILFVFLLQQSECIYVDGSLTLQSALNLDASAIRLGCKVNLTDWLTDENSYLSVLRARGDKELTDSFMELTGFADQRDTAAETTEFLDIVREYTATMPEEDALQYQTKVVDFCVNQDKLGEAVVIEDLSRELNEAEPEALSTFVNEQQEIKRPVLIPDRKKLREFVRISGRNDQLSMSFSSACLGETIMYDRQTDSLTITNIPAPLKLRLIQHMQKLMESRADEGEE